MSNNNPRCLHKAPIVEFIWELRFSSELTNISEVFPGLLYSKLSPTPSHVGKLPHANLPLEVLQQDPNLRYIPTVRLDWESPYIIQLGEHVISLNGQRSYTGWSDFKDKIVEVARLLSDTKLINKIERFSVKYINVLSSKNHPKFPLDAQLRLGNCDLTQRAFHVRTELKENDFLQIIQVISPLKAELMSEILEGTLIDIDTIYDAEIGCDFLQGCSELLDKAHELNKNTFFSFLTKSSLSELEPEY